MKIYLKFSLACSMMSMLFNTAASTDFSSIVCDNEQYLKCVLATKSECTNAFVKIDDSCMRNVPDDVYGDELRDLSKKYADCSLTEFIQFIGKENWEICSAYLDESFSKYSDNVIKKRKAFKEDARKREEKQYK